MLSREFPLAGDRRYTVFYLLVIAEGVFGDFMN
jgi:hypothetical protein